MCGTILLDPVAIVALVGRYPANKLMARMPTPDRRNFNRTAMPPLGLRGINPSFPGLSPCLGKVAYALLTRAPVVSGASSLLPLDLHVLGLSLAFILSQDQTLRCMNCSFLSLSGCPSLLVSLPLQVLTVACYAFLSLSFSSIANPSKISLLLCGACPPACAPLPFRKRMQR